MIDLAYNKYQYSAREAGHAPDLAGRWSDPDVKPLVAEAAKSLAEWVKPLTGFTGFKPAEAKSSRALDALERRWFGEIITCGSFPRRQRVYALAIKAAS